MRHDLDKVRRGAVIQDAGKTRVTMYLDNDVIDFFRNLATSKGRGYQTEVNAALRTAMSTESAPAGNVRRTALGELRSQIEQLVGRVGRLEQQSVVRLAEPRPDYLAARSTSRSTKVEERVGARKKRTAADAGKPGRKRGK